VPSKRTKQIPASSGSRPVVLTAREDYLFQASQKLMQTLELTLQALLQPSTPSSRLQLLSLIRRVQGIHTSLWSGDGLLASMTMLPPEDSLLKLEPNADEHSPSRHQA